MKNHYSVSGNNQLVIRKPKTKKKQIAAGRFGVDKENRLVYWLNVPLEWRRVNAVPDKIIFKGSWRLSGNHDLELVLDKTESQFQSDVLTIKGDIISTRADSLAFEVKTYDTNGLLHIRVLKLSVTWLADEANRIGFIVKKRVPDIITLEGDWRVGDNQQINYVYEKEELKRKKKISKVLTFEGFWRINRENRLTYIIKHGSGSKFDFRAQIESPSILAHERLIKYRLGYGLRGQKRSKEKIIFLYGVWKFSRNLALSFQLDYGNGEFREIEFSADIAFNDKNKVTLSLKGKDNAPLGINVAFTHKFLKSLDAQAFLRLKAYQEERRLEAGLSIPF